VETWNVSTCHCLALPAKQTCTTATLCCRTIVVILVTFSTKLILNVWSFGRSETRNSTLHSNRVSRESIRMAGCYTDWFVSSYVTVMVVWTWRRAEIDINIRRILLCARSVLNASRGLVLGQTMPAPPNFLSYRYEYEHTDKISLSVPLTVGDRTMLSDFPSPRFCLSAILLVSVGGVASSASVRGRELHNNSRPSLAARYSSVSALEEAAVCVHTPCLSRGVSFLPWPHSCF